MRAVARWSPDLRSAGVCRYARNLCLGRKVVPSIGITAPACCVLLSLVLSHVSGGRHPGTGQWRLCGCTWERGFMLFQASCRIPFDKCARGDPPLPLLRRAARSTPIYRGLQEWLNLPLHWRCIFLIPIDRAPKLQATATLSADSAPPSPPIWKRREASWHADTLTTVRQAYHHLPNHAPHPSSPAPTFTSTHTHRDDTPTD